MESCSSVIYMIPNTWIMVAPGPDHEEVGVTTRIRIVSPFNETISIMMTVFTGGLQLR